MEEAVVAKKLVEVALVEVERVEVIPSAFVRLNPPPSIFDNQGVCAAPAGQVVRQVSAVKQNT